MGTSKEMPAFHDAFTRVQGHRRMQWGLWSTNDRQWMALLERTYDEHRLCLNDQGADEGELLWTTQEKAGTRSQAPSQSTDEQLLELLRLACQSRPWTSRDKQLPKKVVSARILLIMSDMTKCGDGLYPRLPLYVTVEPPI